MRNLWTGKGKDVPINQKWEAFKQELKELTEQELNNKERRNTKMQFWEIEMITGTRGGYYEVVYIKDETFELFGKYLKEIEEEVDRLKQLEVNKSYFGNDGWWEIDYCHLQEEEQLTHNFDQPIDNAFILYEAINEVLKKYGYDYNKEATEIENYINAIDCMTTVGYELKKSQVEQLNKMVKELKEVI